MKSLIILDRDGVINHDSKHYIKHPDEWQPISNSLAAIAKLKRAGYIVTIATNQSGIARGLYDETMLKRIHQKMQRLLETHYHTQIDYIAYCPHAPDAGCLCRKPKPGLLIDIAKQFSCDLSNVPFVGDSYRDIEAGIAAGCQPILVKTGNGDKTLLEHPELQQPDKCFDNLNAFVDTWLMN